VNLSMTILNVGAMVEYCVKIHQDPFSGYEKFYPMIDILIMERISDFLNNFKCVAYELEIVEIDQFSCSAELDLLVKIHTTF
jgi:hypothetical protein